MAKHDSLTDKQAEFVAEYLRNGRNATAAYANTLACQNLNWRTAAGFYVYGLVDPRDHALFYVGKGCRDRALAHVAAWRRGDPSNPVKRLRIDQIMRAVGHVNVLTLAEMAVEDAALEVERAFIQALADTLTNIADGSVSERERRLAELDDMLARWRTDEEWESLQPRSDLEREMRPQILRGLYEARMGLWQSMKRRRCLNRATI